MINETKNTEAQINQETNKRARYSAGMLLNHTDLTVDQTYFLGKDYSHNRNLHGYGTVSGLEVSYEQKDDNNGKNLIKVSPGIGIDRLGRTFTLDQVYCADLDAFLAQKPSDYKDGAPIYVVGYYAEKAEDERPVAALLGACGEESSQGGSAASRVVDSFCLKLLPARPPMPLWEATRDFYDGLEDPTKLDEIYRQWVKEDLPVLRDQEARTLGQTDGAAILLGKVVLKRDDDKDESDEYPRAEEDNRPYLLHTQLIQGLHGLLVGDSDDTPPPNFATLEQMNDDAITIWLHTQQPLRFLMDNKNDRYSLLVTKALLGNPADPDQVPVQLRRDRDDQGNAGYRFAWQALFTEGSLNHGDLLTFEFDPHNILYGLEEDAPTLAKVIEDKGLNFLGYDGHKIRQHFMVVRPQIAISDNRIHAGVRTLKTVPFVTITPGRIYGGTEEDGTIRRQQVFELWFHLDIEPDRNRGRFVLPENRLPITAITVKAEQLANRETATNMLDVPVDTVTRLSDTLNIYWVWTRVAPNDDLNQRVYLRFIFDLNGLVVRQTAQGTGTPIHEYMLRNHLNFEGYWLDNASEPTENNPGKVIVYVRNPYIPEINAAPMRLEEASVVAVEAQPAKRPATRKRTTK
jgi:hypothetical protein